MHEIHVVKDLFEDILKHARQHGVSKVTRVYIKMGNYTEINDEVLRYFFTAQGKGTVLEGVQLDITKSPTRELRLLSFDCE